MDPSGIDIASRFIILISSSCSDNDMNSTLSPADVRKESPVRASILVDVATIPPFDDDDFADLAFIILFDFILGSFFSAFAEPVVSFFSAFVSRRLCCSRWLPLLFPRRTRVRTIDDDNDDVGLAPRRVAICPLTIDDVVERSIIDVKVFMLLLVVQMLFDKRCCCGGVIL